MLLMYEEEVGGGRGGGEGGREGGIMRLCGLEEILTKVRCRCA